MPGKPPARLHANEFNPATRRLLSAKSDRPGEVILVLNVATVEQNSLTAKKGLRQKSVIDVFRAHRKINSRLQQADKLMRLAFDDFKIHILMPPQEICLLQKSRKHILCQRVSETDSDDRTPAVHRPSHFPKSLQDRANLLHNLLPDKGQC